MTVPRLLFVYVLSLVLLHGTVRADVLELKNGTVLSGRYAGGAAGVVKFETSAGVQTLDTAQIISLTFTKPVATAAPASSSAPTAATPAKGPTVSLAAGTTLLVRMMDSISSKNKSGARFTTKLEYDLGSGSTVAVKAGTTIYGKIASSTQAGRALGKSTLDLRLSEIVIDGRPVPILTGSFKEAGQDSIVKAGKGAAAGAAIGAIAGDAGMGAAIGATAGALFKGQTVTIPPGTLLEFTLTEPVTITATN